MCTWARDGAGAKSVQRANILSFTRIDVIRSSCDSQYFFFAADVAKVADVAIVAAVASVAHVASVADVADVADVFDVAHVINA